MSFEVESFRALIVWQRSSQLTVTTYRLTADFPKSEMFGLTNQMRRAGVCIASNIAEGYGRNSTGEYKQFLGIDRGSNLELQTQIVISHALKFGSPDLLREGESLSIEVAKMLNSLMRKLD